VNQAKQARSGVEMSFNNAVRTFTHTNNFPILLVLQSGQSNLPCLHQLWDIRVLFSYLFTCAKVLEVQQIKCLA
jgi:hypothetical protein